jgi:hypothetical protein
MEEEAEVMFVLAAWEKSLFVAVEPIRPGQFQQPRHIADRVQA